MWGILRFSGRRGLAAGLALILSGSGILAATGCSSANVLDSPGIKAAAVGKIQLRISDAPWERMVALDLTLTSVKAITSTAEEIELLAGPCSVEVTHLAGTNQPLAVLDLPARDYTRLEVSVSGSTVTYLDAAANPVRADFHEIHTITADLNPTLALGTEPIVVNLDLDVPNTVYLDLANNTVQVNAPVFHVSMQPVAAAGAQYPENGRVEHAVGLVTSATGTSLTVTSGQSAQPFTFNIDENTILVGADLGAAVGTIVEVEGSSQSDGSLLAARIENLTDSNGAVVEGLATGYTGSGPMNLVVQDGIGAGVDAPLLGGNVTVSVDGTTSYAIDAGVDMTGLSLVFDENTVKPGQRIEVVSYEAVGADPSGLSSGLINANVIELQQQALSGTVANYSAGVTPGTATFDLILPADGNSYLSATNPGTSSVRVYQQSTTDVHGLASGIADGQTVQVRGLLFYSDGSSSFVLVGGRIQDALIPPS